jgi:plastocyanin
MAAQKKFETVEIRIVDRGRHARVDPPILQVGAGDQVQFKQDTGSDAIIAFASGGVLVGVGSMEKQKLESNKPRTFTVSGHAGAGVHEYVVCVVLDQQNHRHAFAVGASTPKIIIRPTT